MRALRAVAARLLAHGGAYGAEMLDDLLELYRERRHTYGRFHAVRRACWDFLTLFVRAAPPRDAFAIRGSTMPRLVHDVRHAWRALTRRPLVTVTAMFTLALGMTLALLAFAVIEGVMLRPLPFPNSHELLSLVTEFRPESGYTFDRFALSAPEIEDYRSQSRLVDVAAWTPASVALIEDDGTSRPLPGIQAASGVFRLLDVRPLSGRTLEARDDVRGAPCSVVIGEPLWRERFAASASIVGRRVNLSGQTCEIVGVMPRHFRFPGERTQVWLPLALDPDPNLRANHGLVALGRMRPGTSLEAVRRELSTLMSAWQQSIPHHKGHGIVVFPLKDDLVGSASGQLTVVAWAVALVLVLIVVNVAALLLAHGEARRTEFAIRGAIGASRLSMVRQITCEGLLVSLGACALGTASAWVLLPALVRVSPDLPRSAEIALRVGLLPVVGVAALVIGFAITVLPAAQLVRARVAGTASGGERGRSLSLSARSQRLLVAGELALAAALATAALLLAQSADRLSEVPLGFDRNHVAVATVSLPEGESHPRHEAPAFFASLRERIGAQPQVEAVGAISALPLQSAPPPDDFTIDGEPVATPSEPGFNAHYVMITPGVFDAMGIALIRGRSIDERDAAAAPAVAVINETAAARYWPRRDPIGTRIRYATGVRDGQWSGWGPWLTIVGVAKDVRFQGPRVAVRPAIYVAHAQQPRAAYRGRTMTLVVRTRDERSDVGAAIRRLARGLHAQATVGEATTLGDVVATAHARPLVMGRMVAAFAAVGVLIAAIGVYGVVAYAVARRTREIGVRMALGATRRNVAWTVAKQTAVLLAAGLTAGAAATAWMAAPLRAVLFGVEPFDPATGAAVALLLVAVVAAAVAAPVRRAMRVDPLVALRSE